MTEAARRLSESTRALLRQRVPRAGLPFAEAVVTQVARPLGGGEGRREMVLAARIAELLNPRAAAAPLDAAALVDDPVLLAAVFQNIDLLYAAAHPEAERVGALVMNALDLAARPRSTPEVP